MKLVASALLVALCVSVAPVSKSFGAVGSQRAQDVIEKKKKKKKKKSTPAPAPAPEETIERSSPADSLLN